MSVTAGGHTVSACTIKQWGGAMAYATNSITSRIEWCRRQRTNARAQLELEEWQAEEEGLLDALFNRDHTNQYQHCPSGVYERYVMGLQDGQAMIRTAAVDHYFAIPTIGHLFDPGSIQERHRG